MNKSHLLMGAAAFAVATSVSQPVFAQDTVDSINCADTNKDGVCDSDATAGDAIVVTGSRIRKSEFNSPDPIQVINPDIGQKQGQNQLQDLLQSSPIAQGSIQITSSISNGFVTNGGADTQTISLRGLGAERTLVLLNGRRAGPAGIRGAVSSFDLNVLPLSIVRQVEVLKTGASSIYGSDAVAGVVNILTKDNADGFQVGGFTSIPQHGGGETYDINLTYGKRFDRGHILATVDYFQQQNLRRKDRGFLSCSEDYLFHEDGSRADIIDFRTGRPACNGTITNMIVTTNDYTGPGFTPGLRGPNGRQIFAGQYGAQYGQVGRSYNDFANLGVYAPTDFFGLGFNGPSQGALNQFDPLEQISDVYSKVSRVTGYLEGSYELSDSVEIYTELLFNNRKSYNNSFQQMNVAQFTGNSPILVGAFCNPDENNCDPNDVGDPFNAEFGGNFLLIPLVTTKSDFSTDVDYYRGVLGLRGDFGGLLSGWNWDIYGQYSRSDAKYTQDVIYQDALASQTLRTRSCVGQKTSVRKADCMDIDFTDPRVLSGEFTPQERAFLFGRETGSTLFKQLSAEATLSGNLFTLPAGDVGAAFGMQIRRDQIKDTPGATTLAGNAALRTSSGITAGRATSKEIFGEIQVPLIYNTPFIQRLTLTGAARYTKVNARLGGDTTGASVTSDSFSDTTWKAGLDWEVNDWLRFRGTWGTSFRAPALFELFLRDQTGFATIADIDPCIRIAQNLESGAITQRIYDNCVSQGFSPNFVGSPGSATVVTSGGLGTLRPETSTAKTASIILTPDLSGLLWGGLRTNLAVDYFDIKIRNEITSLGAANILRGCYNSDFFPDEPLCDLFTRIPEGEPEETNIDTITDEYINVSRQRNRGFDVTLNIAQDLGNLGNLEFRAQMTWQIEDKVALFPGTVVDDNGESGEPKWVGDFSLAWNKGGWTIFYGLDVTGGTSDRGDLLREYGTDCPVSNAFYGGPVCPDVRLSPTFYHSMSVTREVADKFAITLGVANLFDTPPPRASTVFSGISAVGQAPVFGSQYDYLGRRIFLNIRGSF